MIVLIVPTLSTTFNVFDVELSHISPLRVFTGSVATIGTVKRPEVSNLPILLSSPGNISRSAGGKLTYGNLLPQFDVVVRVKVTRSAAFSPGVTFSPMIR